ncbi:Peroxidase [Mycena venus]|uniref:Peroxidase n=1 Tax=Mycena venus TaxID=2733690 RepID=A0A8H6XR39_9AGAR|nr:Peroxidase [Mycena venus]
MDNRLQHPYTLLLSDPTFCPMKVESGMSHAYIAAPDSKPAMQAKYPNRSYILSKDLQGEIPFYTPDPEAVDLFWFNKGGRHMGISLSCSGHCRSDACFPVWLMWRPASTGKFYTHPQDLPNATPSSNTIICDILHLECNPEYGSFITPEGLVPKPANLVDKIIAHFDDTGFLANEIVDLLVSHMVVAQDHVDPTIPGLPCDSIPGQFDSQFFIEAC